MDQGPINFTSDVSLPKDDKKAMQGKKSYSMAIDMIKNAPQC